MGIHGNQQEFFQITLIIVQLVKSWMTHQRQQTQQIEKSQLKNTTYRAHLSQSKFSHDFPDFSPLHPQSLPSNLSQCPIASNQPHPTGLFPAFSRVVGADRTTPIISHTPDPGYLPPTEPQFSPRPNMPNSPSVSAQTFSTGKTPPQTRPNHPAKPNSQSHIFLGKTTNKIKNSFDLCTCRIAALTTKTIVQLQHFLIFNLNTAPNIRRQRTRRTGNEDGSSNHKLRTERCTSIRLRLSDRDGGNKVRTHSPVPGNRKRTVGPVGP